MTYCDLLNILRLRHWSNFLLRKLLFETRKWLKYQIIIKNIFFQNEKNNVHFTSTINKKKNRKIIDRYFYSNQRVIEILYPTFLRLPVSTITLFQGRYSALWTVSIRYHTSKNVTDGYTFLFQLIINSIWLVALDTYKNRITSIPSSFAAIF